MAASRSQLAANSQQPLTPTAGAESSDSAPAVFSIRLGLRFMKLELRAVTKHFGSLAANENVDLIVEPDRYTDCSGRTVQARPR